MVLRRMSAGRSHVARIAVVSLVSLGLMGLSGAANADKPGDTPSASPSGGRDLCLPKTPVDDLHLPVDLPHCAKKKDPSAKPSHHSSSPSRRTTSDQKADPGDSDGIGPICVPLSKDVINQLPVGSSIPTCLPKCVSAGLLRTLKNLPDDTLNELLGDITQTLGELPDCLLSLLPKPAPTKPPSEGPTPSPSPTHSHHKPSTNPTITTHVPSTAGPAAPIDGSPDFTG